VQSYKKISPFFIPYAITNMGSALVAIEHGFMGPNYSISTACATANYAFHAACMHIRNGEADVMIAGGSEAPIIPVGLGGFVACRCLPRTALLLPQQSRVRKCALMCVWQQRAESAPQES
jgi:3-oxoacyl-[acyl-carrier-protein] synthase II